MATIKRIPIRSLSYSLIRVFKDNIVRGYCSNITSDKNTSEISTTVPKSGFAQAFDRHSKPIEENDIQKENQSFATLLRNSKFIDLGDPEGKIVSGTIYHIVGDDLYIDFGWKFHCVCQRPTRSGNEYVRGSKVKLRVKDLELSTRFLGSSKDITILEADCQLLGLIYSPARASSKFQTQETSE